MKQRPDILWVVTTQWRAQATGYAGDVQARTPFLDTLAAESVNYTQAVTPHPFGPFARAALLTGKRSPENGVVDYYDPLPVGTRTVAHAMAERGYRTAYFGKWHLAERSRTAPLVGEEHARMIVPPEARGGFDHWEGFESGFLLNDPWVHGTGRPEPVRLPGYQSDVIAGLAADWLRQGGDGRPRFCVVSLEAPHPPYDAPAAGIQPMDTAAVALPPNVPRGGDVEAKARRELAGYYAHIEATDRAIGRLWQSLRDAGHDEQTLLVFTSVHGDMHGAHGLFRKGWPHEESVRVPLLVRFPARSRVGRDERAVSIAGLSPAVIHFLDTQQWPEPAGVAEISMPSVVKLPHQCDRVWQGVRTAERKVIWGEDGKPWLAFDLKNDPGERDNRADDARFVAETEAMIRGRPDRA